MPPPPAAPWLSYSHPLDSIWRDLSHFLHLLIGVCCFVSQPVDHSRWFAAKGGMWTASSTYRILVKKNLTE
jgi:hypothetical protein